MHLAAPLQQLDLTLRDMYVSKQGPMILLCKAGLALH